MARAASVEKQKSSLSAVINLQLYKCLTQWIGWCHIQMMSCCLVHLPSEQFWVWPQVIAGWRIWLAYLFTFKDPALRVSIWSLHFWPRSCEETALNLAGMCHQLRHTVKLLCGFLFIEGSWSADMRSVLDNGGLSSAVDRNVNAPISADWSAELNGHCLKLVVWQHSYVSQIRCCICFEGATVCPRSLVSFGHQTLFFVL